MDIQNFSYVALLRGINVGGNNLIKMIDLKACFEKIGFTGVVTYIQSGNVLFESEENNQESLISQIELALNKTFDLKIRVVVISHKSLKEAVKNAPLHFGMEPAKYRYDVIFIKSPLTSGEAIKSISIKEGVDRVSAGKEVIYSSRLIEKATQSHMSRLISLPVYQNMTIRNWNTTTKLLNLIEQ